VLDGCVDSRVLSMVLVANQTRTTASAGLERSESRACWPKSLRVWLVVLSGAIGLATPAPAAEIHREESRLPADRSAIAAIELSGEAAYQRGWLGLAREVWTHGLTVTDPKLFPEIHARFQERLAGLDALAKDSAATVSSEAQSGDSRREWKLRWRVAGGEPNSDPRGKSALESVGKSPPAPVGLMPAAEPTAIVPVLERELVIWNSQAAVHAVGLADGRPPWRAVSHATESLLFPRGSAALGDRQPATRANLSMPAAGEPAICVASGRCFATLGQASKKTRPVAGQATGSLPTLLACLDLSTAAEGRLVWLAEPPDFLASSGDAPNDRSQIIFDSPPLADAELCVVTVRSLNPRNQVALVAFDARDGRPRWVRLLDKLAPATQALAATQRICFAEDRLIVATQGGAIQAFSRDGQPVWLTLGQEFQAAPARSSVPIFSRGRILITTQGGGILALDARSGRQIWKTSFAQPLESPLGSAGTQTARIVGLTASHAILQVTPSGATSKRASLRLVALDSGQQLARFPAQSDALESAGQALLVGNRVFWPTRPVLSTAGQSQLLMLSVFADTLVLDGQSLSVPFDPEQGPIQLVAGRGTLVVANRNTLVCFESESTAP